MGRTTRRSLTRHRRSRVIVRGSTSRRALPRPLLVARERRSWRFSARGSFRKSLRFAEPETREANRRCSRRRSRRFRVRREFRPLPPVPSPCWTLPNRRTPPPSSSAASPRTPPRRLIRVLCKSEEAADTRANSIMCGPTLVPYRYGDSSPRRFAGGHVVRGLSSDFGILAAPLERARRNRRAGGQAPPRRAPSRPRRNQIPPRRPRFARAPVFAWRVPRPPPTRRRSGPRSR